MKIATRQSQLALKQAEITKTLLANHHIPCELLPMETKGDKALYPFFTGKGLFVKELQEKLLNHEADIAVHSLKDLPVVQTPNLALQALLPRAAKEDVLVISPIVMEESGLNKIPTTMRSQLKFEELKSYLLQSPFFRTHKMGTSSLRRELLFKTYFGLETAPLRGNVNTRLNKVRNNEYSCTFLAKAGLERINLFSLDSAEMFVLDPKIFVPSGAQGIIAVETCANLEQNNHVLEACKKITSIEACIEAGFERLILFLLEGDCNTPTGVYFNGETLFIVTEKDSKFLRCEIPVSLKDMQDMHDLLNTHHHFYTPFFSELCASSFAQFIYKHLKQNGFL